MPVVLLILWSWILIPYCLADTSAATLTAPRQEKALKWLQSTDPEVRRKAHQILSQLSAQESEAHEKILQKARAYHQGRLQGALEKAYPELRDHGKLHQAWEKARGDTLKQARRDLKKDSRSHRKLTDQVNQTVGAFDQLEKRQPAMGETLRDLNGLAGIVLEFDRELALHRGREAEAFRLELDNVYDATPWGDHALRETQNVAAMRARVAAMAQCRDYNGSQANWAKEPQRQFAKRLNRVRSVLGLAPLYLQRELCRASFEHCQDMRQIGYFSHTSPTPGRQTPSMRAKLARYPGRFQGENIFMGRESPDAAYDAWWLSDGHRKILLAEGPSHLGIARDRRHWTMMVGRGSVPSS